MEADTRVDNTKAAEIMVDKGSRREVAFKHAVISTTTAGMATVEATSKASRADVAANKGATVYKQLEAFNQVPTLVWGLTTV